MDNENSIIDTAETEHIDDDELGQQADDLGPGQQADADDSEQQQDDADELGQPDDADELEQQDDADDELGQLQQSRFQCHWGNCFRSFKRRWSLEVHLRTHTGERPFVCLVPGCSYSYTRSQHLSRHIQRAHCDNNTQTARLECPHCNADFANWDSLRLHEKRFHTISEEGKLYQCPEEDCRELFRKKQQLVTHKKKYHNQELSSASRCYKCPHEACGKSFSFPNVLKRHMKIHEGYKCNIEGCDEVLPTWMELRKHKAKDHCPDLVCHTCQSTFKTRGILVQHMKIHQPNKIPFACTWEGCDRTFLYKKNLSQHIRSYHEGEIVFFRKRKLPWEKLKNVKMEELDPTPGDDAPDRIPKDVDTSSSGGVASTSSIKTESRNTTEPVGCG